MVVRYKKIGIVLKIYVSLTYMTGILPIAKYSSGSELNMFLEYSMATQERFADYFGFTQEEVDVLFQKYIELTEVPAITVEGLRIWYNGYHTASGQRIYNPRSVVAALSNNRLANYWTSSGPYDEIFYYIRKNIADVRSDLAFMLSGEAVSVNLQEYAATSMNLQTKDEIFSAMVVYGFLSSENGKVLIPNKELMDKFSDISHLDDVDSIWKDVEEHTAKIIKCERRDEDLTVTIQKNKEEVNENIAEAVQTANTAIESLTKKVKYAYWIAGSSAGLSIIELILLLMKVI